MSSLDYLDLCRLCLVKDRVSVPIFEGEGDVRQIFLKIAACLPVKVSREDKLPKKICDDCVYKVELFYQFWNTTANAEKQLLQWLGEVGLEDKQGYVTNVLNPNVMKPEPNRENRLDGNVMQQVSEHQSNMSMGMMDNMGMGIPMMISTANQQQITSVPMDTSGNTVQTVQAVPGPSSQATHNQMSQNQSNASQQGEEEESSEEEENSDDECDGDEGLPVKEESEEDPNSNRTIEPTTFVNVSLACDEAGPSGLQQQKIADMPDMPISQSADGDPKSGGRHASQTILTTDSSGRFIIGEDSVPMRLWQHVDASGKLHYSLAPSLDGPTKSEDGLAIKIEQVDEQPTAHQSTNYDSRYVGSLVQLCEVAIGCYICDKCGIKFPMEKMLARHKLSHNLSVWLRRKRNKNKSVVHRLRVNAKKRKQSAKLEKREYKCTVCDFRSDKRTTLAVHVRKHKLANGKDTRKILNACTICGVKCKTRTNLSMHMREHRNSKNFRCDRCSFECQRSSTLVSHLIKNHRIESNAETCSRQKRKIKSDDESEDTKLGCLDDARESIISCAPGELEIKEELTVTESGAMQVEVLEEPRACNLCDFKGSSKSALYSHKRQQHRIETIDDVYTCNECGFKTSKKASMYSHRKRKHRIESTSDVYSCNECGYKTDKKSSLYSHIKRKHKITRSCTGDDQPELFYCSQCEYKNKNKYELKVHVARKHTDDFKFSCETCGKKFKVKGDLTNHIRFSHKEQPVICDVCGKTCTNSNSLYVHQKFAHYKAKFECQVCKRRMVSQENLNEHMLRQHEKRENVVCEECGKTFSRNSRLKIHMRIHTGDKPYTCTICGKSFARRTALKQHLLIHTGIRPYICDICGKAFTQKPGLISHRKSHPGPHPPLPRVLIDHILNDVMNN